MHVRENRREREVIEEYLEEGWDFITKGCPDLIVFKGDKVKFIEVKPYSAQFTHKKGLSAHQRKFISLLKQLGLDVEVRYVR